MSEFYTFASENPWLAPLVIFLSFQVVAIFLKLCNRLFRTINVAIRGWPTAPNMDADGDIVHPEASK